MPKLKEKSSSSGSYRRRHRRHSDRDQKREYDRKYDRCYDRDFDRDCERASRRGRSSRSGKESRIEKAEKSEKPKKKEKKVGFITWWIIGGRGPRPFLSEMKLTKTGALSVPRTPGKNEEGKNRKSPKAPQTSKTSKTSKMPTTPKKSKTSRSSRSSKTFRGQETPKSRAESPEWIYSSPPEYRKASSHSWKSRAQREFELERKLKRWEADGEWQPSYSSGQVSRSGSESGNSFDYGYGNGNGYGKGNGYGYDNGYGYESGGGMYSAPESWDKGDSNVATVGRGSKRYDINGTMSRKRAQTETSGKSVRWADDIANVTKVRGSPDRDSARNHRRRF